MNDIFDLKGKTAIITGASSGLGLTTALYLQKKGYKVFGTCRNPSQYEKHYPFTFYDNMCVI